MSKKLFCFLFSAILISPMNAYSVSPPAPNEIKPVTLNFLDAGSALRKRNKRLARFNACVGGGEKLNKVCANGKPLIIHRGDILSIRAWGKIVTDLGKSFGPNGTKLAKFTNKKIYPNHPFAALLCKLSGEPEHSWRFCGNLSYGRIQADGQLQFLINDADQQNNLGSFKISIGVNGILFAGEKPPWDGKTANQWYGAFEKLPRCYCNVSDVQKISGKTVETYWGKGKWDSESYGIPLIKFSGKGHPGGVHDFRFIWTEISFAQWNPKEILAGQQCIYNRAGKLITQGWGAGTPDFVSPDVNLGLRFAGHKIQDEKPFYNLPVDVYLKRWPPDQGDTREGASVGGYPPDPIPCPTVAEPPGTDVIPKFRHLFEFSNVD